LQLLYVKQKDTNITVINLFTNEDHKMIKKSQNNSEQHPTHNNAFHGSIAATNINAPVTINNNIINRASAQERFRYLLLFLESKRILTNPMDMEVFDHCVHSVLEIKKVLNEITKDVALEEEDINIVRKLQNACNNYLDATNDFGNGHIAYKRNGEWEHPAFSKAMKSFRRVFKVNISTIISKYELDFSKEISGDC